MYRNSQADFTNWQVLLLVRQTPGLCLQEYTDLARENLFGKWTKDKIRNAAIRLEKKGRVFSVGDDSKCRRLFPAN